MSKKRAKVEFRYYEMPEKDLVLALLGEKWIRTYGKDIDYLHFHNYLEIGLCHYGEGIVVLDEKEYRFQDNSIVIIPPRLPHTTNASVDTKAYWEWMYFDIDTLLEEIYPQDKLNLQELKNKIYEKAYYFLMEEQPFMEKILNLIVEECKERKYRQRECIKGLLQAFVSALLRMNKDEEQMLRQKKISVVISPAIEYVEKNYDQDIKISKLADVCNISESHFRRVFAVIMWHISNEYGGECHCPACQAAFQKWLQKRYKSIDNLNEKWCTTFWIHRYQSFEQIESPSSIGECQVHGLTLDWKRFVTEQTADFAKKEIQAVKEAGAMQPTTVNLMYDYEGLNYDYLAECVDIISWDSYPVWHKQEDIVTAWDNGLQHDYMRSLKHKPYLLMESCPSGTNWQGISKLKRPGMLSAASLQAIAHGSDSVLYFQIRQSRGSSEKFHGAVIDHYGGKDTRVFKEVAELGKTLEQIAEVAGSSVNAQAAVIYDVENRWAIGDSQGPRNDGMYYHEAVMKSYAALRQQGLNVDVISEAQSLKEYRLIVAPMLYLFREGIEEKIRQFVEAGGTFVMTYWSGIVDENDRCFLGGHTSQSDGRFWHQKNRDRQSV